MRGAIKNLGARIFKRLRPFGDVGFWVLTLLSLVPLFILNRPMTLTFLQWSAFFIALAGASLVICRILLPQVDLSEWLAKVKANPTAVGPALVVFAVAFLLGFILLSMVLWAKT